jgi:CBS domain-containing protein
MRAGLTMRRNDLEAIRVGEAMHRGVVTCTRDTRLSAVAEIMAAERMHCVVVTDDSDIAASLWGVVSDMDLVAAAGVRDLDAQSAGGSAASPALMVAPDDTLQRAVQLMTEHAAAHLIVVESASGRPIGVLSTLDIAQALAEAERR